MEPYRLSWYSNCWIEITSIDQYIFHEKIADDDTQGKYRLIDDDIDLPVDPLFIGKIQKTEVDTIKYYCRRMNGKKNQPENADISLFPAIPSSIHFLTITYKHPEMEESIDITLNYGWFMEGNEILGPSFVYRQLMYQSKTFVFDNRYEIHILDDNIQMFQIGYDEYIEINSNGYEIINYNKPYDCVFVSTEDTCDIIYGNASYQSHDSGSKDM